jgi:hypothetical protein
MLVTSSSSDTSSSASLKMIGEEEGEVSDEEYVPSM